MTYLQTHNRIETRRTRLILGIGGCVIIIVSTIQFFAPHFFSSLFTSLATPFWRTEFSINSGSVLSTNALIAANEDLKRQLAEADVRLQSIQSVEAENTELKSLFGRASTTPYILAAVLMRPPFSNYDELIIDAGQDHGFADGNKVYAPGSVLIGRISDVLGQTSRVVLLSSPGEKYQVLIGTSHAPATAVGKGGGQYEAQLPRDFKVNEGDFVTVPSLNDKPFGIVTSVIADPAQPFETVLFAPPVNVYDIRWVLIDKKNKSWI